MTIGLGSAPLSPSTDVIPGLFSEHLSEVSPADAIGLAIAPVYQSGGVLDGEYIKEQGWRGLDFSQTPGATTPISFESESFPDVSVDLGSQTFSVKRYPVGKINVSDRKARALQAGNDFAVESYVASTFARKAAIAHSFLALNALATTGNYAAGHASDPGNFTSPGFGIIENLQSVVNTLLDTEKYQYGDEVDVFCDFDLKPYFALNTQVRNRVGTANDTIPTDDDIQRFLSDYLPGAKLHWVTTRYRAADGTVTKLFADRIAFCLTSSDLKPSFLRTLTQGGELADIGDIRNERSEAMPGYRWYCDSAFDMHVSDSEAAVLWHTLGS